MNKFSEKIHHQFVSGLVNGGIYSYMQKIASSITKDEDIALFDRHIKNLIAWDAQTFDDCKQYFHILAHAPQAYELLTYYPATVDVANTVCKYAFLNRKAYDFSIKHNFDKVALDLLKEVRERVKTSHPNNSGIEGDLPLRNPYDLDKWVETMRYIYNVANTNNLPLDKVAQQVVAKWEENERINFQRWMKYYQEGNYNKYNVKTAQYFPFKQEVEKAPDFKPTKEMFDASAFPKPDPLEEKKKKLDEARTKLRSRLISVEQLVEKYRDVLPQEISALIRKDVYELKERVYNLELRASVVDSIIRTSNQFNKRGFAEGAKELKKIAQEVAEDKLPEVPAPKAETKPAEPKPEPEPNVQVPQVNIGEEKIEIPDFSSATHRDALQKLEEINKVISERNVVRALAAVDIILGQLGIASYFPQLSEAQSKMMDAFNYAGTRVAETIGQMRGGSGGPIAKTEPKEDAVEVSEEVEKPVGEVVPGGPPKAEPKATPTAPPKQEIK